MEIKPGFYRTRDGRKARVLATDLPGKWPVTGAFIDADDYSVWHWTSDGYEDPSKCEEDSDLIAPWSEPKKPWPDLSTYVDCLKGGMAGMPMAGQYRDGSCWADVEEPTPEQARRLASWLIAWADWAEYREGKRK